MVLKFLFLVALNFYLTNLAIFCNIKNMYDYVSLNYIEEYDSKIITDAVKTAFSTLGAEKFFKPKMKVLVKVNLPVSVSPNLAKTTHPAVVRAVVDVLNSYNVKCILADSPMKDANNLDKLYFETGMLDVANNSNCELNHNLVATEFDFAQGVGTKSLYMLNILNEVDAIVNIGKVKIDENLGYLGATSNLFGLVAGEYKNLVLNRISTIKGFNNLIIDIAEMLNEKLVLNVLDGIVALEAGNTPRVLSCLAISENAFALDASVIDILGLPAENTFLQDAQIRGHIKLEHPYKLIAEKVEKFKLEDFGLYDLNRESEIHPNKRGEKSYFKNHQKRVSIKPKKCKGCAVCSKVCPTGAIMMKYDKNSELFAEIDYSKCIFCFKCKEICPYNVVDFKTPLGYKMIMKNLNDKNKEA